MYVIFFMKEVTMLAAIGPSCSLRKVNSATKSGVSVQSCAYKGTAFKGSGVKTCVGILAVLGVALGGDYFYNEKVQNDAEKICVAAKLNPESFSETCVKTCSGFKPTYLEAANAIKLLCKK